MADITEQQFLAQDPEVLNYQRQRQLANLLVGGAFDQPQGQMISGHFVKPSAISQALPTIKAAIGALTNNNLDTKQNELADMLRGRQSEAMQQYIKASQGTPAQMYPAQAGPMPNGGNIPQQIQTPATGPNYAEMLKAASGRYASPMLQAAGAELLKPIKTAEGETVSRLNFGPGGGTTVIAQGGEKKSEAIRGYELAKSQGYTGSFVDYETGLKKASANHFNFTDILGKDIGQVKDLLTASQGRVQAGEMSINAANKIDSAIKSGNLNVGPGATVGQYMGQVGDALGLVNEKGQDKLVNTRSAIQGLAQMWATSRTQGKGQGAMDQQESQLYGKISSGEIDKISIPELKYMVEQTKSQGNFFRQEHTRMLNELKKDEKLKNIVPFYEVGFMPSQTTNPGASGGSGGVKYLGPAN